MSNCIKTGCHVFLSPHGEYLYGDAFEEDGILLLRICARSFSPINSQAIKHFTVRDYSVWWDENKTSMEQNSTMVCPPTFWTGHGYEGIPL